MPFGRGGLLLGSSPLAIRSVQSPKYLNGTLPSSPARRLTIHSPVCPDETRRIQGLFARFELAEGRGNGARRFLTKLVTSHAIDIVHALPPGFLGNLFRDVRGAAEILRRRNLQEREPVNR